MEVNKKQRIIKYLFSGMVIGLMVGVLLTLYRLLVVFLQAYVINIYQFGRQGWLQGILVVGLIGGLGLIVGWMTQAEPKIGGSGIPQVSGFLKNKMTINWKRVLPFKFFGGLIALACGLSVGREGPSVQMGATIGQALAEMTKLDKKDRDVFVSAGAAAGLAAAFNAPISGLTFVLEELHQTFNKYLLIGALTAASVADYVAVHILGIQPVINFGPFKHLQLSDYILLILMGCLIALLAPIFTKGIYYGKNLYNSIKAPICLKVSLAFVISALVILLDPHLFGSGEHFIFLAQTDNLSLNGILMVMGIKFFLLLVAFCSGMPGGIFLPTLVLGSLLGNFCGQIFIMLGWLEADYLLLFTALAMCANFAAIVRSPLTGMMLLLELTGSFSFFLPVGITVLSTYVVAELLNLKPVYEMLLEMQLHTQTKPRA